MTDTTQPHDLPARHEAAMRLATTAVSDLFALVYSAVMHGSDDWMNRRWRLGFTPRGTDSPWPYTWELTPELQKAESERREEVWQAVVNRKLQ